MSQSKEISQEIIRLRLLEGFRWVDAVPSDAITDCMPGFDSDPARYMAKTPGITEFEGWTSREALESLQEWIDAVSEDVMTAYSLPPKPSLLD